ncbi:hypothetical protein ACFQVD_09800 [Streptosporangium amethystogenes subsp. fukuiense]|uniref:Uncharacterized protein n=1 Tax=Streptosporangium amethystogenes subsp. fukuiense TaxID=698418 RepID=A0ABW2SY42_9ACTN
MTGDLFQHIGSGTLDLLVRGVAQFSDARGRYYASPALARLLDSAPREQLSDRFPGTRAGLIGQAALSGPDELASAPSSALAGLALFQAVRPALAGVRITDSRFFPELIVPHSWRYAAVLVCVPVVAACVAL